MANRNVLVPTAGIPSGSGLTTLVLVSAMSCSACSSGSAVSTARARSRADSAGSSATDPQLVRTSSTTGQSSNAPELIAKSTATTTTMPTVSGSTLEHCDPGSYVGTYNCKLVMQGMPTDTSIDGVVSFDLEVNTVETMQKCPPGAEFCDFDLVIKEGTGNLFGFVLGLVGFETGLQGGLDCRTGKFHASAVGGVYGIPWEDPDKPGKLKVVAEVGTFDGTLDGFHSGKTPQVISGTWNLGEPSVDIYCPGPFSVELTQ